MPSKHPFRTSATRRDGNAYKILAAIAVGVFSAGIVFTAFPIRIDAFWPFLTTRAADDLPKLHDTSIDYLDAAANPDPNPSKGGLPVATTEGSALIPSGGPVGALSSASFGGSASGGEITLYTVREGDNLSEIADMFSVSMNTILWANDIKDAKTIQPGDELLILPVSGVKYEVQRGGTLHDVAKKFDADVEEIALFNGIDPDAPLAAGTELIVPGGNLAPAKKTTAKASSGTKSSASATPLPELSGYFGNPVAGGRVTQGIHGYNGIDVGAPQGTAVYAAAAGTVIVAKDGGGYNGGYGNYVVLTHDNGTQTLYAHLSSVSVSMGASVAKGALIGGVGNTGRSTGYHLHFEVRGAKNPLAH